MRIAWSLLLWLPCLGQQEDIPWGPYRGKVMSVETAGDTGALLVHTVDNYRYRCRFDQKTWFDHTKMRVSADAVKEGEFVEVIPDRRNQGDQRPCYARTIRLVDIEPAWNSRLRPYRAVTEHIVPRGSITFSGIVLSVSEDRFVLRTRQEGEKSVLIRRDTRFAEDGAAVERGRFRQNLRVFVRAGKTLANELEAYHVVWGEIPRPR